MRYNSGVKLTYQNYLVAIPYVPMSKRPNPAAMNLAHTAANRIRAMTPSSNAQRLPHDILEKIAGMNSSQTAMGEVDRTLRHRLSALADQLWLTMEPAFEKAVAYMEGQRIHGPDGKPVPRNVHYFETAGGMTLRMRVRVDLGITLQLRTPNKYDEWVDVFSIKYNLKAVAPRWKNVVTHDRISLDVHLRGHDRQMKFLTDKAA